MRKVFRVLLLMAIVLSACESEQKRSNMATGMLALNLATSQDVIDATTTRAAVIRKKRVLNLLIMRERKKLRWKMMRLLKLVSPAI